jgi:hypothetical protein
MFEFFMFLDRRTDCKVQMSKIINKLLKYFQSSSTAKKKRKS